MNERDILPNLLRHRATVSPDEIAISSVGQGSMTWGQTWDNCLHWAAGLRAMGVGPGGTVVSIVPQSFESVQIWQACALLGAVEVPTNTAYRGPWLDRILENSQARTVVCAAKFLDQLLPSLTASQVRTVVVYDAQPAIDIGAVSFIGADEFAVACSGTIDPVEVRRWDTASIMYTSGTTGASKGVIVPWAHMFQMIEDDPPFDDPTAQVLYSPYGPYHMAGKRAVYGAAYLGAKAVIREVFSLQEFWSDVETYGVTWTMLVSALADGLMRQPARPDDHLTPLARVVMVPVIPEVDAFRDRFGVEVTSSLGSTETGTPFVVPNDRISSARPKLLPEPLDRYEIMIADDHDMPVPDGDVGELLIRAREPWLLNQGYFGMAEASMRAWRNGWFHTGDGIRRVEGGYEFVDRVKDVIRRKGENISAFELENAVQALPAIEEVAAIAAKATGGEDDVMVVAALKPGASLTAAELVAALDDRLPPFMMPRYVRFVDRLPRTLGTQKVQKAQLREAGITTDTWDRYAAQPAPAH